MPTVSNLLKNELLQGFFGQVTKLRAYGYYYAAPPAGDPNPNPNTGFQYADNTIEINMLFRQDPGSGESIAYLDTSAGENPINITVGQEDSFTVHRLEFINDAETEVYFHWNFTTTAGSEELIYTGNGELHIESLDFDLQ